MLPSRGGGARTAHALTATILSGVLTYVLLAIVSRTVDAEEFDQFSVFWSIALIVGFGFFLPVEQEAARLGPSQLPIEQIRSAMMRITAQLTIGVAVVAAAATPLLTHYLSLPVGLAIAVVGIVGASAVQFAARGRLLTQARAGSFANALIIDTVLRVALLGAVAIVVTAVAVEAPETWYAVALAAAITLAHVWWVPWRSWRGADDELVRRYRRAVVVLVATSLCAQVLVNAGPIVIQAFPLEPGVTGAFQASSTLARIPLAMITPIQAMLVGPLVALAARGESHRVSTMVRNVALVTALLAVVGGVLAYFAGPWMVTVIFGPDRALPPLDLAILVIGVLVHVALIVITQAVVAAGRHGAALGAWAVALAVGTCSFVALVATAGPVLAVELSFGIGSLAGAVTAYVTLAAVARSRPARPSPKDV